MHINKLWYFHIMEYSSAMKRNWLLMYALTLTKANAYIKWRPLYSKGMYCAVLFLWLQKTQGSRQDRLVVPRGIGRKRRGWGDSQWIKCIYSSKKTWVHILRTHVKGQAQLCVSVITELGGYSRNRQIKGDRRPLRPAKMRSSRISKKPCLKIIRWKTIEEDNRH